MLKLVRLVLRTVALPNYGRNGIAIQEAVDLPRRLLDATLMLMVLVGTVTHACVVAMATRVRLVEVVGSIQAARTLAYLTILAHVN